MKKCIDRIAQDWLQETSSVEIDILKENTVHGQKLAKTYFSKTYQRWLLPYLFLSVPLISLITFTVYMFTTGFMFLLQPTLLTITSLSDNSTDKLSAIPYRVEYGFDLRIVLHHWVRSGNSNIFKWFLSQGKDWSDALCCFSSGTSWKTVFPDLESSSKVRSPVATYLILDFSGWCWPLVVLK